MNGGTVKFIRAFDLGGLEAVDGDGRTVAGRIVPYDEPARVVEPNEEGEIVEYREVFTNVSLVKMLQGAKARGGDFRFVRFTLDHRDELDHRVGYATDIESRDDGAYATFRLYDDHSLPKVQSMLAESHRGLSLEFIATRKRAWSADPEVVERLGVHIGAVTATPDPMYAGASILSVRGSGEPPEVGTPALDELLAYLANGCKEIST